MKKLAAIAFLLLVFLPGSANAHSGLSSSVPAEGASLEGSPEEVQFLFESPIQQGDMTIKDESGNAVEVSDIIFSEMELTGRLAEQLPNGAYTVDWSAISQDSHEITGTLTFNIAAEEAEEPAAEETTEEAAEEPALEDATETTEQSAEADVSSDGQAAEEDSASAVEPAKAETPWITIIIIAILAIAAVTFFVMAKRK